MKQSLGEYVKSFRVVKTLNFAIANYEGSSLLTSCYHEIVVGKVTFTLSPKLHLKDC